MQRLKLIFNLKHQNTVIGEWVPVRNYQNMQSLAKMLNTNACCFNINEYICSLLTIQYVCETLHLQNSPRLKNWAEEVTFWVLAVDTSTSNIMLKSKSNFWFTFLLNDMAKSIPKLSIFLAMLSALNSNKSPASILPSARNDTRHWIVAH